MPAYLSAIFSCTQFCNSATTKTHQLRDELNPSRDTLTSAFTELVNKITLQINEAKNPSVKELLEHLLESLRKQHLLDNWLRDKTETDKCAQELLSFIDNHVLSLLSSVERGIKSPQEAEALCDTCANVLTAMPEIKINFPSFFGCSDGKSLASSLLSMCVLALCKILSKINAAFGTLWRIKEVVTYYRSVILERYQLLLLQLQIDLRKVQILAYQWWIDILEQENRRLRETESKLKGQPKHLVMGCVK